MDGTNVMEAGLTWNDIDVRLQALAKDEPSDLVFDELVDRQFQKYGYATIPCEEAQELLDLWEVDDGQSALPLWQAAIERRQPQDSDSYTMQTAPEEAQTPDEVQTVNDAIVRGKEHPEMGELFDKPVTYMTGKLYDQGDRRNTQKGGWKMKTHPWSVLLAHEKSPLTNHPTAKSKQGDAIVIGETINGERTANAVKSLGAIVIDIDSGPTIETVIDRLEELGHFALVYSSFNHKKTSITLKHDDVVKKLRLDKTPSRTQVLEYLRLHHKDRYEPEFLQEIEIDDFRHHGPNGLQILCTTPPLHKLRIILPLWEPAILADIGTTATEWKENWANIVTGYVVNELGVSFDSTSCDVNRLFYLPRHPKGAEWTSTLIMGRPVRYDAIKPYSKSKYLIDRGDADPFLAGDTKADNEPPTCFAPSGMNLNFWHRKAKSRFMIPDLLETECPDKVRRSVSDGKVEIECPFEHEHSSEGGTGTVAMSPFTNENEVWTISCPHDACQGRHKLEHLEAMLKDGWFEEALLLEDDYLLPSDEPVVALAGNGLGPIGQGTLTDPLWDADLVEDGWCDAKDADVVREQILQNMRNRASYVIVDGGKSRIFVHPESGKLPIVWEEPALAKTFKNANVRYDVDGKLCHIKVADEFLQDPERITFLGTQFEPNANNADHKKYNTFNGFPVAPVVGDWSLMKAHIRDNLSAKNGANSEEDEFLFNYFMTWCADIMQNPGKKMGSSIAIVGEQGVGKSKFFDWLRKALGDYSIKVASRKHLIGNFNSHLDSKLLLVAEEAFWSGDKEAAGVLKDLITSETYTVEKKGVDVVERPNYLRFAFVTNNDWAIPTDDNADARRFLVLRVGNAQKQNTAYFRAIDEQMSNGGLEAMTYELTNWDPTKVGLSWDILRSAPMTAARAEQATFGANPATEALLQILDDGFFLDPNGCPVHLSEKEPTRVRRTDLTSHLRSRLPSYGGASKTVTKALTSFLGEEAVRDRKHAFEVGGKRERFVEFPPLLELRKKISEVYQ